MCLAIPGRVLEIEGADLFRTGRVSFGGIVRQVNLSPVPEAEAGSYVLVHVGMAISLIDEEEAARVFAWLDRIDELEPSLAEVGLPETGLDTAGLDTAGLAPPEALESGG